MNKLKITERIEPTIIPALFKNFDNAEIALLELIDNCIDDRIEKNTLEVSINTDKDTITITNKGGYGMGLDELDRFFAWGRRNKESNSKKLGRYGQGGKAAMGYLARSCQIISTRAGECKEYVVEIDDWEHKEGKYVNAEVQERDSDEIEKGLVKIRLWNLNKKIIKGNLFNTFCLTYAPLLRTGEVKMWVDYTQVIGFEMDYEKGPKVITFELAPGKKVIAHIGIIRPIKGIRGGFRCYEFGRLITSNEFFGQKTREDKYAFEKLAGEIFIDFDIPLVMNKTNFDRDSEDWIALSKIMYGTLDPWIKELSGKRKEPSRIEIGHQKNINKSFEDYRLSKIEKAVQIDDKDLSEKYYENLIPNYKLEFRSLDKHIRYQVMTEDGQNKIFVNISFPAYNIWEKDIEFYLVDILVHEIAKKDSQTIDDFFNKSDTILNDISNSFKNTK